MKKLLLFVLFIMSGSEIVQTKDLRYGEVVGSAAGAFVGASSTLRPAGKLTFFALAQFIGPSDMSNTLRSCRSAGFLAAAATCLVAGGAVGYQGGKFIGSYVDKISQK